jgi:hypothetical protein
VSCYRTDINGGVANTQPGFDRAKTLFDSDITVRSRSDMLNANAVTDDRVTVCAAMDQCPPSRCGQRLLRCNARPREVWGLFFVRCLYSVDVKICEGSLSRDKFLF